MIKRENTCIFILFLFLLGLTLVSCKDDDENEVTLPQVLEDLPSAENIKSTSAYIPVNISANERGRLELLVGVDENLKNPSGLMYRSYYLDWGGEEEGYELKALDPSCTYYYTMVFHKGNKGTDEVYAKQIKTFTTQGANIEFIGQGESNSLRVKAYGVEEEDADYLHVTFYAFDKYSGAKSFMVGPNYMGNGIWEQEAFRPSEGERWQAVAKGYSGRVVAETPIYTFVNGEWK